MGRQQMPIGTTRTWQKGLVIKAHENNIFSSGWIPVVANDEFIEIGNDCDRMANVMIKEKKPISGELFLDHEINEFEKESDGTHPFNPDNFKQYEGFYGAKKYSFKNEFLKRHQADRIKLAEDITKALLAANEEAGGLNTGDNKHIKLSDENVKQIKRNVTAMFKYTEVLFTASDARKLQGIVTRTYNQLKLGVNFPEGSEEKKVYDNAVKVAEELPTKYERIAVKRELKENTIASINKTFKDNWGVRESVKTLLEEKYGEYVRKFSKQISDDEAKDQEATFGVKLDDDFETFYDKLFKKIEKDKEKIDEIKLAASQQEYPFKELIYLRFETLYNKRLDGNWNISMLPVIYNIERFMNTLPAGHFKTNADVINIINKDYGGAEGYAHYNENAKEINFSDKAANSFQIWGKLKGEQEFNSTCSHEIGHAVSKKFGRSGNLDYKKFVVACGWSYQHLKLSGEHATGGDKDIPRGGAYSMSSLLTDYSHKSPEEAFAEYYSIYVTNKEAIDKFLDTNEKKYVEKKSQLVAKQKKKEDEKPLSYYHTVPKEVQSVAIKKQLGNLDFEDKVKLDLINPWHVKYSNVEEMKLQDSIIKKQGIKAARFEDMRPTIVVKNGLNDYTCIDDGHINEGCKYQKKMAPAIVIDREVYHTLKQKFSDKDIINYTVYKLHDKKVPVQISPPVFKTGIEYRNSILDVHDVIANRERLMLMRNIFNSKQLQKALAELFSFDKIRSIFAKPIPIVDENGIESDILLAKANSLISELEQTNKEVEELRIIIDNEDIEKSEHLRHKYLRKENGKYIYKEKQLNEIYHFTSSYSAMNILFDNVLRHDMNRDYLDSESTSFTTDINFYKKGISGFKQYKKAIALVFDINKLEKNSYKPKAHIYEGSKDYDYSKEEEIRIDGSIKNVRKYIKKVLIIDKIASKNNHEKDQLVKLLKKEKIEYSFI